MANTTNIIGNSVAGAAAAAQRVASVNAAQEGAGAQRAGSSSKSASGTPGNGKGRVERVAQSANLATSADRAAPRGSLINIVV